MNTATLIIPLLLWRSPADVSGFVIAVVVDAIQRQSRWTRSGMCKERLKTLSPLDAHRDATAAIVFVIWIFGIKTPLLCSTPNVVFWAISLAMLEANDGKNLRSVATAARRFASYQTAAEDYFFLSAVAAAKPASLTIGAVGTSIDNCKSSEFFSRELDDRRHRGR